MKSKIIYFICGILAISIIAATTAPMWQPPRHDSTMVGVGTDEDPLGVDTTGSGKIATKYQVRNGDVVCDGCGSGSTPGIDDVLAVGQHISENQVLLDGNLFGVFGENTGTGLKLDNENGITTIGDYQILFNGNTLKVNDATSTAYLDNTAHNINVGIGTATPTATLDINGDAKISGTINGVKRYVALLTQSGTDPPVANELENSLIATPNWTYDSEGNYSINCAACFTVNKTWCILQCKTTFPFEILYIDDSTITIFGDGAGDDYLSKAAFEIRVYP